MKNYLKIIPVFLAVPFLLSCRNSTYVSKLMTYELGSTTKMGSGYISYSCQKADGSATYHFTIKDSQSLEMTVKYTVELGALTVTALDKDGTEIHHSIIVEDTEEQISFPDYGSYKIRVDLDEFKGTYRMDWKK